MKKQKSKKKIKLSKKRNNNVSEEQFLAVLDTISKKLAYKFKFGYHEYEDMKQQITVFALEGLKNYDGIRPLENFLWTHVRNRLFNYKRDNYQRPNKPCLSCPLYDAHCLKSKSQCEKYNDKNECELYSSWSTRNNTKKNLMYLTQVEDYSIMDKPDHKIILSENIANKEIFDLLDLKLNGEERELYLRLRGGSKLTKIEMQKLVTRIKKIMSENG
jgi:DNA-directed RNA polymerase specialized sigma24 family protein